MGNTNKSDLIEKIKQNLFIVPKSSFKQIKEKPTMTLKEFLLYSIVFFIIFEIWISLGNQDILAKIISLIIFPFVASVMFVIYAWLVNHSIYSLSPKPISNFKKTVTICLYGATPFILFVPFVLLAGLLNYIGIKNQIIAIAAVTIPALLIIINILRGVKHVYEFSTFRAIFAVVFTPFLIYAVISYAISLALMVVL